MIRLRPVEEGVKPDCHNIEFLGWLGLSDYVHSLLITSLEVFSLSLGGNLCRSLSPGDPKSICVSGRKMKTGVGGQSADQMGKGKGSGLWLCLQAEDFVAAQRSTAKVQNWLLAELREQEGSLGLELHRFHFRVMDQNSDSGVSQEAGNKRSTQDS